MKKVLKTIRNILIIIYVIMVIFITICLLSYNDYKVTTFGTTTLLPIIDDLGEGTNIGDLAIFEKNNANKVNVGDEIYFYYVTANDVTISCAKVTENDAMSATTGRFTVEGDYMVSISNEYLGTKESTIFIPKVGKILSILESKWGFLFLGVFPSILVFLYTAYNVFMEATIGSDDEDDEEVDRKKKKKSNKKKIEKNDKEIDSAVKEEKQEVEKIVETSNKEIENINLNKDKQEEKVTEIKQEEKKIEVQPKIEVEEKKEVSNDNIRTMTEEQKRALIAEKMKQLTPEQKKALIAEKMKNMTEEQKRAFIEAKRRQIEEQKNKNN